MITDVEMQAMELLLNDFLNKKEFSREYYAMGAMQDMLAALDSDWFYSASDEEKKAFVAEYSRAIVGERDRVSESSVATRWICVYKDALCQHNGIDNLVNIEVPEPWLYSALRAEGETDIDQWFEEYTADSTEFIARKAMADGVILGCDDEQVMAVVDLQSKHPELVVEAEKVHSWVESLGENIPESLGFEYKGMWINDPFYDESLRFEVEPFSYYGEDNMKVYLEKATELMKKDPYRDVGCDNNSAIKYYEVMVQDHYAICIRAYQEPTKEEVYHYLKEHEESAKRLSFTVDDISDLEELTEAEAHDLYNMDYILTLPVLGEQKVALDGVIQDASRRAGMHFNSSQPLLAQAYCDFIKLQSIVENHTGSFEDLCMQLSGMNYDGDLFDVNFGVIGATITNSGGHAILEGNLDIWDDPHGCIHPGVSFKWLKETCTEIGFDLRALNAKALAELKNDRPLTDRTQRDEDR